MADTEKGIFNYPPLGLEKVSLDKILDTIGKAPPPVQVMTNTATNHENRAAADGLRIIAKTADPYLLEIMGPDGQPILKTPLEQDAAIKLGALFAALPEGRQRRRAHWPPMRTEYQGQTRCGTSRATIHTGEHRQDAGRIQQHDRRAQGPNVGRRHRPNRIRCNLGQKERGP